MGWFLGNQFIDRKWEYPHYIPTKKVCIQMDIPRHHPTHEHTHICTSVGGLEAGLGLETGLETDFPRASVLASASEGCDSDSEGCDSVTRCNLPNTPKDFTGAVLLSSIALHSASLILQCLHTGLCSMRNYLSAQCHSYKITLTLNSCIYCFILLKFPHIDGLGN